MVLSSNACLFVEAVDAVEENGRTPLMYSAMAGHENCLKLLLKKHAHLSARDSNGQTALHWAAVSVSADAFHVITLCYEDNCIAHIHVHNITSYHIHYQ